MVGTYAVERVNSSAFWATGGEQWRGIPLEFMEYGMIGSPYPKSQASPEPGAFGAAWRAVTWMAGIEQGLERVYHFPTWDEFPDGSKLLYSYGWLAAMADGLLAGGPSTPLKLAQTTLSPQGRPLLNPSMPSADTTRQEVRSLRDLVVARLRVFDLLTSLTCCAQVWLTGRHVAHNASCQVFFLAAWAGGDPRADRIANITVRLPSSRRPARVEQFNGGDRATNTYDEAYRRLAAKGMLRYPVRPASLIWLGPTP